MGAFARLPLLFLLGSSTALAAAGKDVDLKAADGTLLKATYFSAGKPGPGVVLLHMCNEVNADSANALDSLSEAYEAANDHARAVEYAKKALEALPRDKRAGADLKAEIQKAAEARLRAK